MLNRMVFSTFFAIILFVPFGFADLTGPSSDSLQSSWFSIPEPVYDSVPTREERMNNTDFVRFPGWQDMEIVRRDRIEQSFAAMVYTSLWSDDISINSMRDLVLQAFDIMPADIMPVRTDFVCNDSKTFSLEHLEALRTGDVVCSYFIIPFAADIRYRESGVSGVYTQGTINFLGAIMVTLMDDQRVENIKILKFDDSHDLERKGRSAGLIDQYDSAFVMSIASPLLKNYLSETQNRNKLVEFIKPEIKSPTVCDEIDLDGSQDIHTQIRTLPMETIDCIIGTMDISEDEKANFLSFLDTVVEEPVDADGNQQTVLQVFNLPEGFKKTFTESEDVKKALLQNSESVRRAFVEAWVLYNLGTGLAESLADGLGAMVGNMMEGMVDGISKGIGEALSPINSED